MRSHTTSLAEAMAAEGLPRPLRDILLYGIALADREQEPAVQAVPTAAEGAEGVPAGPPGGPVGVGPGGATLGAMSAAAGGEALRLLIESTGRFGASLGAFMAPAYGCGSLPEALVRFCAVHGAVTVLRQPVEALLLQTEASQARDEDACAVARVVERAVGVAKAVAEAAAGVAEAGTGAEEGGRGGAAGAKDAGEAEPGPGRRLAGGVVPAPRPARPSLLALPPGSVAGLLTAGGQVLRCGTLVAGRAAVLPALAAALGPAPGGASAPGPAGGVSEGYAGRGRGEGCAGRGRGEGGEAGEEAVSRALVILDGPLVPGQGLLTVAVPPRAEGVGNAHCVRGLQLGPSACTAPQGRSVRFGACVGPCALERSGHWDGRKRGTLT